MNMTREEYKAQMAWQRYEVRRKDGYNSKWIPKHVAPKEVHIAPVMRVHFNKRYNWGGQMQYHGFSDRGRFDKFVDGVIQYLHNNCEITTTQAYLMTYEHIINESRAEGLTPIRLLLRDGIFHTINQALRFVYDYGQEYTIVDMKIDKAQCEDLIELIIARFCTVYKGDK